ncbi:MAG: phosphoribosylglycinamide formyltransferase [Chitinophagales bacterium]|nr:phosphoribosylglycinamide formyltransferase [Chitinophagales bacterium]
MKRIAIFASGNGSNAKAIIQYFQGNKNIRIETIVCNNPKAKVIEVARELNIPCRLITRQDLYIEDDILNFLKASHIDLIVLAGFLWLIPEKLLSAFPDKIINIHPALLPKFGGKNMYGNRVHESVLNAGEKETGITIHLLNEKYDEGKIKFQKTCAIDSSDSAEDISRKVQKLEHEWYPKIIEGILTS